MRAGFLVAVLLLAAANAPAAPECINACQQGQCGVIPNGCGGVLQCGGCTGTDTCGGGGTANMCGSNATCTGLCLDQVVCPGAGDTTISGTVSTPNGALPLPNATIYVPNAALTAFATGVGCTTCGSPPSGSPLVSTLSDAGGKFVLHNAPVGVSIPLVIQIGRWRRETKVPVVASCVDTAVAVTSTRLPSTQGGGSINDNMPLIAVVSGANDTAECLLRDVGVADNQFSDPTGAGRIHFYDGGGARYSGSTPAESTLSDFSAYDALLFDCQGTPDAPTPTQKDAFTAFVNSGGRVMLDHEEYSWLSDNMSLYTLTAWDVEQSFTGSDPDAANIATTFPKGEILAEWLLGLNPSSTPGQVAVSHLAHDYNGVVAPAENWLVSSSIETPVPLQFAFNTPLGAIPAAQCGRIAYLDHHPYYSTTSAGVIFPGECTGGTLTEAQRLAIYTFFDTTNCVWPDQPDGIISIYNGNHQGVTSGTVIRNLQAQVLASNNTYPYGVPVTFTVDTVSGDADGTFASGIVITDSNGVATAPPLTASGTAGVLKVTADGHTAAPAVFTVYVGDEVFYGGFDF